MYVVATPETKLDRRCRVSGQIYLKLDSLGKAYLDGVAKRLASRGVSAVYAADIHSKAGLYLAQRLNVPFHPEKKLRGFNFGRFNGHQLDEVAKILPDILERWKQDKTVPITGGDSWVSYTRRFIGRMVGIAEEEDQAVILTLPNDLLTFQAILTKKENPMESLAFQSAREKTLFNVKMKPVVA